MIKVAPSILAADPINLERDVRRAVDAGCDWIHVDVMDACFVPNLAYTPETVRRLKETFDVPLDVHGCDISDGHLSDRVGREGVVRYFEPFQGRSFDGILLEDIQPGSDEILQGHGCIHGV